MSLLAPYVTRCLRHLIALNRSDLDGVLKRSIFAEGDELLKDNATVSGSEISLLPPVAGG